MPKVHDLLQDIQKEALEQFALAQKQSQ